LNGNRISSREGEMVKLLAIGLTLCVILSADMTSAGQGGKEEPAVVAAEGWLKLVDEGKFAESWKESAEYFKGAVKQDQWEQSIQSVRIPLGAVISRRLKTKNFATSLPGAPDGEYVVIQFATSFENKASAVETVTPMMDKDGQWRVSGYYIK
jgi:hypothetical protein